MSADILDWGRIGKVVALLKPSPQNETRVVLLHGMGGIGKSTLARAAYREASEMFGDGNFGWCELKPEKKADEDHLAGKLRAVLQQLGMDPANSDYLGGLHSLMASKPVGRGQPVLIWIDDVLDPEVMGALLPRDTHGALDLDAVLPKGYAGAASCCVARSDACRKGGQLVCVNVRLCVQCKCSYSSNPCTHILNLV
jgi:hypothetical protein